MTKPLQEFGLDQTKASAYVFDVVESLRKGFAMDYLEIDSPEFGKRYITTDVLFSDSLFLRKGRTQMVDFDMLKRIPRSSIKMDYLVMLSSDKDINAKRVELVAKKANQLGARLFPIAVGKEGVNPHLIELAKQTRGQVINFSGKINPCAVTGTVASN